MYNDKNCQTKCECCKKGTAASNTCRSDECEKCEPGEYQDKDCQTKCKKCKPGTASDEPGLDDKCPYCEKRT